MLEWVAISFSRGSSWPRDRTCVSCILYHWATREVHDHWFQHSLQIFTHPRAPTVSKTEKEDTQPVCLPTEVPNCPLYLCHHGESFDFSLTGASSRGSLKDKSHITEEWATGMHWESHLKWGKDLKKKDGMITGSTSSRKFDSGADSMTQEQSMQIMPNWSIGPDLYSSTWGSNLQYAVSFFSSINPSKSFFDPEGFLLGLLFL